ncbi:MAG: addiction module toxin RelE [Lachnospiraceae bacterium]|nr:addiction module toxin RelE [Lachnospiraceae bacterium]
MELSEDEKRMLYQMEGSGLESVIRDLVTSARYAPRPEQRKAAESVVRKLRAMPKEESWGVVMDIRRNYHVSGGARTIGEMLAEARQKAAFGSVGEMREEWMKGHDILALERFADDTRHMIVFDVLSQDSEIGDHGEKRWADAPSSMRLFLTDEGYRKLQGEQEKGNVRIRKHAKVFPGGRLSYDQRGMEW